MDIPTKDGLYPGIPERCYHSDKTSFSHSGARAILTPGSPAAYKYWRDNFDPTITTEAKNFGSAVHALVLGGPEIVIVGDDKKTKYAQDLWDQALRDFNIPLRKPQYGIAQDMAAAIKQHPLAARLLDTDMVEMSGWWHDETTGVRLRYRVDALKQLRNGRWIAVDFKTADSAHPIEFAKSAAKYGYNMQDPWYTAGLAANGIDVADFLFVVQETRAPYLVSVNRLKPDDRLIGARRNRKAIELYAQCLQQDTWPGYGDGINDTELPAWYVRQTQQEDNDE